MPQICPRISGRSAREPDPSPNWACLPRRARPWADLVRKYRLPAGRQVQEKLGPAWTDRGRPPAGYFTKNQAEARLREIQTLWRPSDAIDRGRVAKERAVVLIPEWVLAKPEIA
jgi:hypothetical protein